MHSLTQDQALDVLAIVTDGLPAHVRRAFIVYALAAGQHGKDSAEADRLLEQFAVLLEAAHEQEQCMSVAAFIQRFERTKREWGLS